MRVQLLLVGLGTAAVIAAACGSVQTGNPTPTPSGTTPGGSPTQTGPTPTPTGSGNAAKVLLEARCTAATCSSPKSGTLVSQVEDCSSHAVSNTITHANVTLANDQVTATNSFLASTGGASGTICICTFLDVNVNASLDAGDLWGQFQCPAQILVQPGVTTTSLTFLSATHS